MRAVSERVSAQVWAIMQAHGWCVVHQDGFRPYSYTVGLARTGHEFAICGFPADEATALLNRVGARVSAGESLRVGDLVHVDGISSWCRVVPSDPRWGFRPDHAHRFFDSPTFTVQTRQLIVDPDPTDATLFEDTLWADFERWEEEFDV